jgi:hypothetical protein
LDWHPPVGRQANLEGGFPMGQNALAFIAQAFSNKIAPGRVGQQSDLFATPRHGKYYSSVYGTPSIGTIPAQAGSVFRASNQATDAISAALATAYTGLCLSNPSGSTVNLVVKRVTALFGPAPATQINLGLITGWASAGITAHTTPITQIVNAYVGAAPASGSVLSAASQAKVDAACTLVGTPAWDRWLTTLAVSGDGGGVFDLDEDMIIPPGGYVAVGNLIAAASGFLGTFEWEELAP